MRAYANDWWNHTDTEPCKFEQFVSRFIYHNDSHTDLFYFTALFLPTKYKSFIIMRVSEKENKLLKKIVNGKKNLDCLTKRENLSIVFKPAENRLYYSI